MYSTSSFTLSLFLSHLACMFSCMNIHSREEIIRAPYSEHNIPLCLSLSLSLSGYVSVSVFVPQTRGIGKTIFISTPFPTFYSPSRVIPFPLPPCIVIPSIATRSSSTIISSRLPLHHLSIQQYTVHVLNPFVHAHYLVLLFCRHGRKLLRANTNTDCSRQNKQ